MSLQSVTLLLLFATSTTVYAKGIEITKQILPSYDIDVLRERSQRYVIPKKLYRDETATYYDTWNRKDITRSKRDLHDPWIIKDFEDYQNLTNFHAFVVRDEKIPSCGTMASVITDSRYFMCSGAILTARHAITTASCIHFAHIFEHHVQGDMAILVGATTDYNQVIKIARVEMHPHYDYNVESPNYARHNLAILHLECPICKGFASIPKLPSSRYQDLGHLCCPDRCKLLTVVQRSNNRHVARLIRTKHLPSPEHKVEKPYEEEIRPPVDNTHWSTRRSIRSPGKLATAPLFFTRENRHLNSTSDENLKSHHAKRNRPRQGNGRKSNKNDNSPTVGNTNKELLEKFTKKFVDTMITRLEKFLQSGGNLGKSVDPSSRMIDPDPQNTTPTGMVEAMVNSLISGVLEKIDVAGEVTDENERDILETYVECPPLGAPVIRDDILVGMVAYTCDDVQNWVEWKYVDIARNMDWIMSRVDEGNPESAKDFSAQRSQFGHNWTISTTCNDMSRTRSNLCIAGKSGDACHAWKEDTVNSKINEESEKNSKYPYNNAQFNAPVNANN